MMRYLIIAVSLLLFSYHSPAQTLGSRFDIAIKESSVTGHPVMLVFSGSDWCKPCIQFKKSILDSGHFEAFKKDLIVLILDFPYRKKNKPSILIQKENELLADRYNPSGEFPRIILVNQEKKVLGHVEYKKGMTPQEFTASISAISIQ